MQMNEKAAEEEKKGTSAGAEANGDWTPPQQREPRVLAAPADSSSSEASASAPRSAHRHRCGTRRASRGGWVPTRVLKDPGYLAKCDKSGG
eukprot:240047-Pleurochrysis_carterae.AAC.1